MFSYDGRHVSVVSVEHPVPVVLGDNSAVGRGAEIVKLFYAEIAEVVLCEFFRYLTLFKKHLLVCLRQIAVQVVEQIVRVRSRIAFFYIHGKTVLASLRCRNSIQNATLPCLSFLSLHSFLRFFIFHYSIQCNSVDELPQFLMHVPSTVHFHRETARGFSTGAEAVPFFQLFFSDNPGRATVAVWKN